MMRYMILMLLQLPRLFKPLPPKEPRHEDDRVGYRAAAMRTPSWRRSFAR